MTAYTRGLVSTGNLRGPVRKSNIPAWSPNQLRHAAATEARAKHGLDAAQLRLGHKHASTTEIYADLNRQRAAELAEQQLG